MLTVRVAKNKTEEFMNRIMSQLEGSKKKYLIFVENNRGMMYMDRTKNLEFLKKAREELDRMIREEEGK